VHAFPTDGQMLFADGDGSVRTCGFTRDVKSTFLKGGSVVSVTGEGLIYYVSGDVYEQIQCTIGAFDGPIIDAKSDDCGGGPNLIGWNASDIFADPNPLCLII
jgi:hypothetical protein